MSAINLKSIFAFITILIAALIPVSKPLVVIPIVAFLVVGFFESNFISKIKNLNKYTLIFISYYIIHILAMIYTSNFKAGLFDLEIKLSFLIFPIVFSANYQNLQKIDKNKLLSFFIYACIFSSVYRLIFAFVRFLNSGSYDEFFYIKLSAGFHPSYFSMFLCFAVAIIIYRIINNNYKFFSVNNLLNIFSLIFLSVVIVLCSSKAGIFSYFLILLINFIYLIFYKKIYAFTALIFVSIFLMFISILYIFPNSWQRIYTSGEHIVNVKETSESTVSRIMIWKTSLDIIRKNPVIGYGTGDVKDILLENYKKQNMSFAFQNKLNAHNQYFQSFISSGLIGFSSLLLIVLLPLYFAIKWKDYFYFIFLIIIIFNISVESMFETQAGVIFFSFFNSFFFFKNKCN